MTEASEDDETPFAAVGDLNDEDAIWLLGAFPEEGPIHEHVLITILASCGQVRKKYFHRKA